MQLKILIFSIIFSVCLQTVELGFNGQLNQDSQNNGQLTSTVQEAQGGALGNQNYQATNNGQFNNGQLINGQSKIASSNNGQLISPVSQMQQGTGSLNNAGQATKSSINGQLISPVGQVQQRIGSSNDYQQNNGQLINNSDQGKINGQVGTVVGQDQQGAASLTNDQINQLITQLQAKQATGLPNTNDQPSITAGQTNKGKGRPRVKITKTVAEIFLDEQETTNEAIIANPSNK
ncbi:hypothetical protein niasHT_035302 [Heterodera trifolii]|uniref:Uncharacterized protein n=1 Tax=Heterodera trifolii TaxID=157864 RepID=A0ABD2I195_9BILA